VSRADWTTASNPIPGSAFFHTSPAVSLLQKQKRHGFHGFHRFS
jgi:hypothetical protein